MARPIAHSYVDPLDAVWIAALQRIGFRVERSSEVYASTDGRGRLLLGTADTLDPDDCLAQMIFHEICHSLVQGEAMLSEPDWGLSNEDERDVVREHACLRLQAALAGAHGLRTFLAPTTDFRAFYDDLPLDPFEPATSASSTLARVAFTRASSPPWAPHLARALEATAAIVRIAVEAGASEVLAEKPPLYRTLKRAGERG